ncbi:MAG: hypothetical protein JWN86_3828 [Planctomycetota bacterium]|nr:hypothetical protein [Planctomycetota bacterium]
MAGKSRSDSGVGQSNRFRFVLFEGELSEGNMGALAQAITAALRPTPPAPPRIANHALPPLGVGSSGIDPAASGVVEGDEGAIVSNGEDLENAPQPRVKASSGPRSYPKVKVITDVDLESDMSFPDFAASKKPKSTRDRYLIAAAWYKLHRKVESITMHHIYTCFLHPKVRWSTSAADFDQPLRELVKTDRLGRVGKGQYAINHIGIADVEQLGTE